MSVGRKPRVFHLLKTVDERCRCGAKVNEMLETVTERMCVACAVRRGVLKDWMIDIQERTATPHVERSELAGARAGD